MKYYVLVYEDGAFAGLDMDSGGYPFKAPNICQARIWPTLSEARYYNGLFSEKFRVTQLEYTLTEPQE